MNARCYTRPNEAPEFSRTEQRDIMIIMQTADPVTISIPRALLTDIRKLSTELVDRMHELLERNANGSLPPTEAAELRRLVQMAEFGEIISMALQSPSIP